MRKLILIFDEKEIDELMASEAIRQFELPWVKNIIMDDGEFFPITSVSKDDLRQIFHNDEKNSEAELQIVDKVIDQMSDSDMEYLASKMADAYCDECFWIDLKIIFEERFLREAKSNGL